jgi:hypothetical protein
MTGVLGPGSEIAVMDDPFGRSCTGFPDDASSSRDPANSLPCYEAEGLKTNYAISFATTRGQCDAADSLMRRQYQWRGYSTDVVRADSHAGVIVVSQANRVVATVTVAFDSPAGMAAESLYPAEVAKLRRGGAGLCEFTRLAVDRAAQSMELLAMLFHVAYLYARRVHDATHLLVEVNPRHVRFYTQMLGFRIAGPQRVCRRVGAPAILLSLSLDHAEEQIGRYGGNPDLSRTQRSLYPCFFSPSEEARITRRIFGSAPLPIDEISSPAQLYA